MSAKEDHMADDGDHKNGDDKQNDDKGHKETFKIQIDRAHYEVHEQRMTGLELRHVPPSPIGPDRDLFEVVPGGSDRKIENETVVEIRNGLRFFTAPAQINPGNPR
jgi:hypothetical protein